MQAQALRKARNSTYYTECMVYLGALDEGAVMGLEYVISF